MIVSGWCRKIEFWHIFGGDKGGTKDGDKDGTKVRDKNR